MFRAGTWEAAAPVAFRERSFGWRRYRSLRRCGQAAFLAFGARQRACGQRACRRLVCGSRTRRRTYPSRTTDPYLSHKPTSTMIDKPASPVTLCSHVLQTNQTPQIRTYACLFVGTYRLARASRLATTYASKAQELCAITLAGHFRMDATDFDKSLPGGLGFFGLIAVGGGGARSALLPATVLAAPAVLPAPTLLPAPCGGATRRVGGGLAARSPHRPIRKAASSDASIPGCASVRGGFERAGFGPWPRAGWAAHLQLPHKPPATTPTVGHTRVGRRNAPPTPAPV